MLIASRKQVYSLASPSAGYIPEAIGDEKTILCLHEGKDLSVIVYEGGELALRSNGHTHNVHSDVVESIECVTIIGEVPPLVLMGTEAPHLYQISDNGKPAKRMIAFDQLNARDQWYTPWGGPASVRSIAHTGDWVYADIHVGSIMRSPDRGTTWEPVKPTLHEDVHQVITSHLAETRVYANTADAVYVSEDHGNSWEHRASGLSARYGRAIAVHPHEPDCLLATVSQGPGSDVNGQLYRSDNVGRTWSHVTSGFPPSTYNNIDTFQVTFSSDGTAWAVVEKVLYKSDDRGNTWEISWEASDEIIMLSCA